MEKYLLSKKRSEEFNSSRYKYRLFFHDMGKYDDPKAKFLEEIQNVINDILEQDSSVKKIGLILSSSLLSKGDLKIPFTPVRSDFVDILSNEIFKLQQSDNFSLLLDLPFDVEITTHAPSRGRGKNIKEVRSYVKKTLLFDIDLKDGLCLIYSIKAAMDFYSTEPDTKERKNVILKYKANPGSKRKSLLKEEARTFINDIGIKKKNGYTLKDVENIQTRIDILFPGLYRIVIFGVASFTKPIYKAKNKAKILLPLYFANGHFVGVKNLSMFTSGKSKYKYCIECESVFDKLVRHDSKCILKCGKCMSYGDGWCIADGFNKVCATCNRFFGNEFCYNKHIEKNICRLFITCDKCGITYSTRTNNDHQCKAKWCNTCKSYHEARECYIKKLPLKDIKDYRIIIYDFETSCEKVINEKLTEHEVVYAVAYVYCTKCIFNDTWKNEEFRCEICGPKRWYKWSALKDQNCVAEFLDTMLYEFNNTYKSILMAHNSSRFDILFCLRKLYELNTAPKVIKNGNKFYMIQVPKRKTSCELIFKDTYLFLNVALDKLVSTFNLDIESKAFFPYGFIKAENFKKVLPHLPPKEDYYWQFMPEAKQKLFDIWYEENYNTEFSLEKQLDIYNISDVQILAHSVVAFFKLFYNITKTDPFESHTISGACMKAYCTNFMPENSIAIMPEHGLQAHDKASVLAIKYLLWLEKTEKMVIQHRNSPLGEKRIAGFKCDGWQAETNTVFEINEDYFHGCPTCIKDREKIMPTGRTAELDYERTMERVKLIEATGVKVKIIWECQIKQELKANEDMRDFFKNEIIAGPISPRDALFGGRVSPQQLYAKAEPGYCIKIFDVRSLYPAVQFNSYPLGFPEVIEIPYSEQDVNWTSSSDIPVKGILQVFVIPPQNLVIPVIPMHHNGGMYFTLCRSCCIKFEKLSTRTNYLCPHNENERGFLITITHMELGAGLDRGYRVIKYFNAYHYENWSKDLFSKYLQTFGKVKLEAEGWPNEIKTEADKEVFIQTYKEKFGIDIDRENVKKNPSLKFLGKMLITSLWGKFCQKNGKDHVLVTSDPLQIDKIMYDESKEVKTFDILNENLAMIVSKDKKEFIKESNISNVIIGVITTSMARLKLFGYLETVYFTEGASVIYFDTDSCFVKCRIDNIPLKTGPYLGDLSDEWPDHDLRAICAAACKAYAVKMRKDGEINFILKCKGVTVNAAVAKLIHYKKFKQLVKNFGNNETIIINCFQINPDRTGHVYTRNCVKRFKAIFYKGYILDDFSVRPFGYLGDA